MRVPTSSLSIIRVAVCVLSLVLARSAMAQELTPPATDSFDTLKGWVSEDIGDGADLGGSETSVAGGELILVGSGSRAGGEADGLRFAYQRIRGDFIAQVKVTVLPTFQPSAAAGLMVRQDTFADGAMAFVGITRDNGTLFVSRNEDLQFTEDAGSRVTLKPAWLRLERRGEYVRGSVSPDGETWTNLVGASGAPSFARIALKDPVLLGLAVHAGNATAVDIAHFADFSVVRPPEGTGGVAAEVTVAGSGEPAEGAYLRALDAEGKETAGAYVTGGTALIPSGLPAGSQKLQVVGAGYEAREATVSITAGQIAQTSLELTSTLAPPALGTLKGTVANPAGKGQAKISVRAISQGPSALGPLFQTAITDSQGRYTLDLPAGTYSVVRLSDPRYVPVEDEARKGIAVAAGQATTVDFQVEPLPVVALSTDNGYEWKIKLQVDPEEDHKAVDDPETDFVEYIVNEGKFPWGVLDPTPRIYAWVRLKFRLPDSLKAFRDSDLRLYDFTFEDVDVTYWNGVQIGSKGFHKPDVDDDSGFVSAWNTVRDYRVPASAVNWDGDNVIAIFGFVRNSTVENGGFSVKSPPLLTAIQTTGPKVVKGDVNGDGRLTVTDAVLALRIAAGLVTPTPAHIAAGALGDGKRIAVTDVLRILRAVAGLAPL